ncbi:serine hydrolase domain-containing protein [Paenibacillus silvisoli]|uniref:serine hydrolase domain-containing protein n=1 Tax=Paenibacillus silvisoli TaxID=3110539 RepID=UPI002804573D|nr:serine hydrolase [Paenibacillus silvisoli]
MPSETSLPRSDPETQGVSSAAILSFIEEIERRGLELHGFMLLRHDHVIAEGWWAPYKPEYPHEAYSLTKSITSTAIGLAIQEGLLSVEDSVLSYFPDLVTQSIDDNMSDLKIKHLLSMSTGHTEGPSRFDHHASFLQDRSVSWIGDSPDRDWVRGFLELPIQREPGTHFLYNGGASHTLAKIVEQATGACMLDYLYPRLFEPLGIEKPAWERCPKGTVIGDSGIRLKAEDIARFGLLLLRKGIWNGNRILSEEWLEEAASKQVDNAGWAEGLDLPDYEQGYGYQFWISRRNIFQCVGAFGKFCIVMPDQDAVLAINGGFYDTLNQSQALMNVIRDCLLDAMVGQSTPADVSSQEKLQRKLASLAIGEERSVVKDRQRGGAITYTIEPNTDRVEELTFHFAENRCQISWRDAAGEHALTCGIGEWEEHNRLADEQAAARGLWRGENTFVIDIYRIQTPIHDQLICVFDGTAVDISYKHRDGVPRHLVGRESNLR